MEALRVELDRYPEVPSLNRMMAEVREAAEERRSVGSKRTVPPEKGLDYWARRIVKRIEHRWDALVVVTGPRGTGKSTLAMRLAVRISELLKKEWSPGDGLCYSAREVLAFYRHATETGERGRVAIFDEGVRGLLSTETVDKEQVALVRAINLVRESGCVLILCIPDMMSLAKSVRSRLATLWIAVRSRGMARVNEREARLWYKPESTFGFTVSPVCPHLVWDPYRMRDPIWRAYLPRKRASLMEYLTETDELLSRPKKSNGSAPIPGRTHSQQRWLTMRLPESPEERRALKETMEPWEWEALLNRERQRKWREKHGLSAAGPTGQAKGENDVRTDREPPADEQNPVSDV
jgi:hypothetical protein